MEGGADRLMHELIFGELRFALSEGLGGGTRTFCAFGGDNVYRSVHPRTGSTFSP